MNDKKVCFVIMGFGKKKDPISNRTIDLDATFNSIIKPAVIESEYTCIRADEISDSGLIDRSMYALLYYADLVIADISTHNPNAIYELGVRHTFRPYSTIIIREDKCSIPFDFNHNRMLSYEHLGNEISEAEAQKSKTQLKGIIANISKNEFVDSPLYTFIPQTNKPTISTDVIMGIIGELKSKEDTIYSLQESAKQFMADNDFVNAAKRWNRLKGMVKDDDYFIQQEALCVYKSKQPSETKALTNALIIIKSTSSDNDTETLGIHGAINKNLWIQTSDISYLEEATELYKRGWNLHKDYYTGENYAFCMEQRSLLEQDKDMQTHNRMEAKITREEIVDIVLASFEAEEIEEKKWKYATLSNCFLALSKDDKAIKYENLFLETKPLEWEKETYQKAKQDVKRYIQSIY